LIALRHIWLWFGLTLGVWSVGPIQAQALPEQTTIKVERASLQSLSGTRVVSLPHMLASTDFAPEGGTVTYTLQIDLPQTPPASLGIYVPKMALSGHVYVNGHRFTSCERGELKDVRCLHRPYLFSTPASIWQPGRNEISFEIYASARQSNGLSTVWLGDVNVLDRSFYRFRYWLQVDLLSGLTWLSAVLGVLAIAVGIVLRKDSVYLWFGLTSTANALANAGVFLSKPFMETQWFNWFVFTGRFLSVPFVLLMFAAFFDKLKPWVRNLVVTYTLLGVVLIGLSGSNRTVVIALYAPLMLAGLLMPLLLSFWTWKTRQLKHLAATGLISLIMVASVHDWLRLTGASAFEGMYWIPYAYSGVLFMYGGMLLGLLAYALVQSQELSANLEARVIERTEELKAVHRQLMDIEVERSKTQERERMLQDMHDGFGSQLVIAKMMTEQKKMSQDSLALLLQECIVDLHMVVDTLGNREDYLSNAFIDFKFRTEQRLAGIGIQMHWNLQLEKAPEISQQTVLQILRITQEALNNALKHAQAMNIWIEAIYKPESAQLTVRVCDDGVGLNALPLSGRGLNNMKSRARAIKANLSISNIQPGTEIILAVKL
jgi:signal transduction histidine kinase